MHFKSLGRTRLFVARSRILATQMLSSLRPAAARSQEGDRNMEAEKEIRSTQSNATEECAGELHLWTAVVTRALEDWRNGTLRERRAAQRFLFEEHDNFSRVCANAGLDPSSLRAHLSKIGRKIKMEGPWSGSMAA